MISLNITTTHSRLELCSATIWSLLWQERMPDVINVWVSKEPYLADEGINKLPKWFEAIQKHTDIVKFRFTDNIGPYRKIIPILKEASNTDTIVYCDDDVIYSRLWLSKILDLYDEFKGGVAVASRIRLLEKNIFGFFKSYNFAAICKKQDILENNYIITGIGGCVVNRGLFKEEDLELNDFLNICPTTDDLWISALLQRAGTRVIACPSALLDIQEILHGTDALNALNVIRPKGNFIRRKFQNFIYKVQGYLGIPISKNDHATRAIKSFFYKS